MYVSEPLATGGRKPLIPPYFMGRAPYVADAIRFQFAQENPQTFREPAFLSVQVGRFGGRHCMPAHRFKGVLSERPVLLETAQAVPAPQYDNIGLPFPDQAHGFLDAFTLIPDAPGLLLPDDTVLHDAIVDVRGDDGVVVRAPPAAGTLLDLVRDRLLALGFVRLPQVEDCPARCFRDRLQVALPRCRTHRLLAHGREIIRDLRLVLRADPPPHSKVNVHLAERCALAPA